MYASPILSRALTFVYGSKQWRAAMDVTSRKANYPLAEKTAEDSWIMCPPPSIVTFVGTLVSFKLFDTPIQLTLVP